MEPMTDAFMTAVALMAVAEGRSHITGIANQRVKECNRIEVRRDIRRDIRCRSLLSIFIMMIR